MWRVQENEMYRGGGCLILGVCSIIVQYTMQTHFLRFFLIPAPFVQEKTLSEWSDKILDLEI